MGENENTLLSEDTFKINESITIIKDGEEFSPSEPDNPVTEKKYLYKKIENFYERVRSALNVGSEQITNEIIDYFENAPMAEMRIKKRVPQWKELEDIKKDLFETCIIYMTCYALCPMAYAYRMTEQTTPSLTLKFDSNVTDEKPCERFLSLIDDIIAEITDKEISFTFGFKVTPPSEPCYKKHIFWDDIL